MTIRDKTAIAGVGATPYYRRGESYPRTELEMACRAVLLAVEDAGLTVADIDGFALFAYGYDPAQVAAALGVPEVRFSAQLTSGGGGSAGALGLAAAAIEAGMASCVVTYMTLQQRGRRIGGTTEGGFPEHALGSYGGHGVSPLAAFTANDGLIAPGHQFAWLAQRHMHLYGTRREHFAEVCISSRDNATRRPQTALHTKPLTLDDYFNARMISDPLCLFDYTVESDGAVAVVTVAADRARDLRQPPAYILASAHGGSGRWGPSHLQWFQMPDDEFASSGHRPVARRLYEMAGIGPADVDVALLYDHFSPLVIMQLEDYGFAPIGEGGRFVADGHIRWKTGSIPVNTHGGHLSEAYIIGMTHVREAVEQLRGVAVNQVDGAEVALVTGGPAALPVSSVLLRR